MSELKLMWEGDRLTQKEAMAIQQFVIDMANNLDAVLESASGCRLTYDELTA